MMATAATVLMAMCDKRKRVLVSTLEALIAVVIWSCKESAGCSSSSSSSSSSSRGIVSDAVRHVCCNSVIIASVVREESPTHDRR